MHRLRLAALCALALVLTGTVQARTDAASLSAPAGLKAFLLRADEPTRHEFSRTPAFAWTPVRGALRYEFELATSKRFGDNAIIWSNVKSDLPDDSAADPGKPSTTTTGAAPAAAPVAGAAAAPVNPAKPASVYDNLRSPAVAVDVALPWITGSPYALWAHVRAITPTGATPWSDAFGFNMRWSTLPTDLRSPYAGLVRWSPVEGATAYEVWLFGAKRVFTTTTNVADLRDLYTFHRTPLWTSSVNWRVRAKRTLYGEVPNGLPVTTFGPWTQIFTHVNPPLSLGVLGATAAVSDTVSAPGAEKAHELTPGFVFSGDRGGRLDYFFGQPVELFRIYVATDVDCVNIVYRGAIVGGPAYAPRVSGPLALPADTLKIVSARLNTLVTGKEGEAYMLDGTVATTTEAGDAAAAAPVAGSSASTTPAAAKVDLWDTSWPAGGYYWTVVPVMVVQKPVDPPPPVGTAIPVEYRETELPQDACQSGRVMRFGKTSPPVTASARSPFASGLSPRGLLVTASQGKPSFYGTPIVAWQPALGATSYEVQWSKTEYPWKAVGSVKTPSTSVVLPLTPGKWSYRVRGLNYGLPKRPQMSWSEPLGVTVSAPSFSVLPRAGR